MASELVQWDSSGGWGGGRDRGVGSSDAPVVMGVGYAGSSRYRLWEQKTGRVKAEYSQKQLEVFEKGHAAEPYIADLLRIDRGWSVQFDPKYSYRRSVECPFMLASLDGWVEIDGEFVVLEFKNVNHFSGKVDWDVVTGRVPLKYAVQIQHQMFVTGANRGFLVRLSGFDLQVIEVPRDEEFLKVLVEECRKFWWYVQADIEPPADESIETFDALCKSRKPKSMGVRHLDVDGSLAVEQAVELESQIEELTRKRQKSLSGLVQQYGDAEYLVTTDGRWFSFKAGRGGGKRVLKPHNGKVVW